MSDAYDVEDRIAMPQIFEPSPESKRIAELKKQLTEAQDHNKVHHLNEVDLGEQRNKLTAEAAVLTEALRDVTHANICGKVCECEEDTSPAVTEMLAKVRCKSCTAIHNRYHSESVPTTKV